MIPPGRGVGERGRRVGEGWRGGSGARSIISTWTHHNINKTASEV